jgi:hypothetical protein
VKDTPPEIELRFRNLLLKRSGEERLKMGCSMHAASLALVKASVSETDPVTLKRTLFLHFYGNDFEPKRKNKILRALKKSAQNSAKQRRKVKEKARKIF